jgi:hypothetical protein
MDTTDLDTEIDNWENKEDNSTTNLKISLFPNSQLLIHQYIDDFNLGA